MPLIGGTRSPVPLPIFGKNSLAATDHMPQGYTASATGCTWDGQAIRQSKGRTRLNSSAAFSSNAVNAGFDFQTPNGKVEIICGANGTIAKIVNGTVTNIVTGRMVNSIHRGDTFMGKLILTNGFDQPIAFPINADASTGPEVLTAPNSFYGITYNNHFFVAHQPDGSNGPSVVQNSASRDLSTFNVLNAYNIESNNNDVVRAFFKIGGYLGIAKQGSLTLMRGSNFDQTNSGYDAYLLPPYTGGGIFSQGSVTYDRYGRVYYFNDTGFWRLDGVDKPPVLISKTIDPDMRRVNLGRVEEITGIHVPSLQEMWWSVPVGGDFEFWRYVYRPDSLRNGIGAWWPMPWTDVTALWTYESSPDQSTPRCGTQTGFAYKMDDSWSDNGSAYNSHVEFNNIRGSMDRSAFWKWVIGTYENTGVPFTLEAFPEDQRQAAIVSRTVTPSAAQNTLTADANVPISGRSKYLTIKVSNATANRPWAVRDMTVVSQGSGDFI